MTATERLRAMLDERGVEWSTDTSVFNGVVWTIWKSPWFGETWAKEVDGSISLFNCSMTPEQAIEATLGRGECHKLPSSGDTVCIVRKHGYEMEFGYWKCSACGCECFEGARYCMNCGRKVRA